MRLKRHLLVWAAFLSPVVCMGNGHLRHNHVEDDLYDLNEPDQEHRMIQSNQCIELPKFDESVNEETVVSFYAMGDVPYSLEERYCLNKQLRDISITNGGPSFLVHIGDIKRGLKSWPCDFNAYNDIASIFSHPSNSRNYNPRDVFFVPGDNEWNDCDDMDAAWKLWTQHFGIGNPYGFGTLSQSAIVERQTGVSRLPGVNRQENFAFFLKDVLFLSINTVGSDDIGDEDVRLIQNFDWVKDQLAFHKNKVMKACFVFGHAPIKPTGPRRAYFGEPFFALLRTQYVGLPVMYVHGDWHDFCVRKLDNQNPNLYDLELEDGGFAPPVLVSVVKNPADGTHLIKIDQRGGLYKPPGNCEKVVQKTWGQVNAPQPPKPKQIPNPTAKPKTTLKPKQTPKPNTKSRPTLPPQAADKAKYKIRGKSFNGLYGLCQGDCDKDTDCRGALLCSEGNMVLPNCFGTRKPGKEYCYDAGEKTPNRTVKPKMTPKPKQTPKPNVTPLPTLPPQAADKAQYRIRGKSFKGLYGRCQGDCDKDKDCKGALLCSEGDMDLPGCFGTRRPGKEYCYDAGATKLNPSDLPYRFIKVPKRLLIRCQGDCNKDSDCKGKLRCFKEEGAVPGCYGRKEPGREYCYLDKKNPPTPTKNPKPEPATDTKAGLKSTTNNNKKKRNGA